MRDGAATKEIIQRMALRLFVEKGIRETTIRDIASAADVAEGTLYRHYGGKEELAWDLYITNLLAFGAELEQLKRRHRKVKAQHEAMVRRFCRFFDEDPVLFGYLLLARHALKKRLTPKMRTPFAVVQEAIAEAMKRKEVRERNPVLVTAMMFGVVQQVADAIVGGRLQGNLTSFADDLVAASWRVLKS
jgi:AcrR family transcriptional regulator